jgi:hypothetical protein
MSTLNITNNSVSGAAMVLEGLSSSINMSQAESTTDESSFGQMMVQKMDAKVPEPRTVTAEVKPKKPQKGGAQNQDLPSELTDLPQNPIHADGLTTLEILKNIDIGGADRGAVASNDSPALDPASQTLLASLVQNMQASPAQITAPNLGKAADDSPAALITNAKALAADDMSIASPQVDAGLLSPIASQTLLASLVQNMQASPAQTVSPNLDGGIKTSFNTNEVQSKSNLSKPVIPLVASTSFSESLETVRGLPIDEMQDARIYSPILNINSTSNSVMPAPQAEVSMLENMRPLANELTLQNTIVKSQLGSPSWHAEIGQKIVWMIGGADQSATLTLNPPNLGPLKVLVHVHNNDVNTAFISNNPEVRQALQDGLDYLRQSMAQSGITLGQTHVGSGNEQSQAALWQQQFSNASNGGFSGQWGAGGGRNQGVDALIQTENGLADRGVKNNPSQDGLVNTFA